MENIWKNWKCFQKIEHWFALFFPLGKRKLQPHPYTEPWKKLKQDEEEILRNLETRCFYEFAKTLEREGQFNFKYAGLFYQRAAQCDVNRFASRFDYGTLLMNTHEDYSAAAAAFPACVDLDPSHVETHQIIGTIYTQHLDRFDLARQHYEKYFTLQRNPLVMHILNLRNFCMNIAVNLFFFFSFHLISVV